MSEPDISGAPRPAGAEEARVARGTIVQQAAQVVGAIAMLVVVTLVGRSLPLAQFGLYGLLISIAAYLLILQLSVEGATVRAIAGTSDPARRERIASLAFVLYVGAGLVAGAVICGGGLGLVEVLPIPADLEEEARDGVLALGAVTAAGWPFKVFQDVLRGTQRFLHASAAEIVGHVALMSGTALLLILDAPLWALIAIGGSLSVLFGLGSLLVLLVTRTLPRFRRDGVSRSGARELLGFSAYLSVIGVADLVLYSVDRLVLAAFTSTSTVGLYEGAARPHNLVRQVHGTLVITVLPVASGYLESGDEFRVRELLVRGTRYVAAIVVPLTVVLTVFAGPILEVWLGDEFRTAGTAMAIITSYWVLNAATGVAGSMLVAAGEMRWLTAYAWATAALNLTLSVALTAWLGLEGVMLGTAIPYVLLFPVFLRKVSSRFGVAAGDVVRVALVPAWAVGAGLAVALVAVRLLLDPESLVPVLAVCAGGLALAYAAYAALFFGENERRLMRGLLRT